MSVFRKARLGLLLIAALALAGLACSAVAGAATKAKMADSVVESIGVNTHLNYDGTPYQEFAKVRQSLQELGIRHIRDQVGLRRADINARFRQLGADGIDLNVIAGDPRQRWGTGTIDQQLNVIQNELGGAVASIEGPNEYDLSGFPNWAEELRTYTRQLAEGVRSRPKLAALPIIGPSIVIRENEESIGDLSQWIDYGNTHTYMGGEIPETSRWNDELAAVRAFAGNDPVMATETGYQNAVKTDNGHLPTSEKATATYMPRLFLECFRRGIARSYGYQLIDERYDPSQTDIEASFGLLRPDFSKKPAALATQNLISLLSDKGTSFTPGELDYSIEGAPSTAQQVLLQKRDGSFYLALWNRVSVWDRFKRVDLNPADVNVTVRFGQAVAKTETFEPNLGAGPVASTQSPTSLKVSLSPRVQIIKVTPADARPPAPGPAPEQPPHEAPVEVPAFEEEPPSPAPERGPVVIPTPAPAPSAPASSAPAGTPAKAAKPAKPATKSQPAKRNAKRASKHGGRSCRPAAPRRCKVAAKAA